MTYRELGRFLREKRIACKLKQSELAAEVGLKSGNDISKIELGYLTTAGNPIRMSLEITQKMVDALKLDAESRIKFMILAGYGRRSDLLELNKFTTLELISLIKRATTELEKRVKPVK